MTNNLESNKKTCTIQRSCQKKALEYYYANKEAISQTRKEKYKELSPEKKKKLQEYNRRWFNNQSPERQLELRQKAKKYHKNRYDSMMVRV